VLVPYRWLKDYIDPGLDACKIAELLTLAGIEVGTVERFGPELPGVVTGKVIKMETHPGRSNLTLVKVETGSELLDIVCGAKNFRVGDIVPVAKPGAELPGERRIEETILYGTVSSGMLCSAHELGLEIGLEDEILILDQTTKVGETIEKALDLDEEILTLELTPNRSDCLGLIGVAYEVASLTGAKVKLPLTEPVEAGRKLEEVISIMVEDPELCPRYTARAVEKINIGSSPLWMQLRLLKAGIRPISNVVDITNYVMWEYGQPLHAFDLDLLEGGQIIVRRGNTSETLITLDGVKRLLDQEVLVIADCKRAVGLAGVMGGENTEITTSTKTILIEAAAFNPTNIRRTARRYNLSSEASQRFEKGVNHEAVIDAQNRAAYLINKLVGGELMQGAIDINSSIIKPWQIEVDPARINKILGMQIPEQEIADIFKRLDLKVEVTAEKELIVTVPLRRPDLVIEEDLVEEVVRLYGYDQVPITLPTGELLENREAYPERVKNLIKNILVSSGFYECITYSFINPVNLDFLKLPAGDPRRQVIPVQNPFSEEQSCMRTTLMPGLLRAMRHNISYRELDLLLFEIGIIYNPKELPLKSLPEEKNKLTLMASGSIPKPNWLTASRPADFYVIKGALENVFSRLQINCVKYIEHAEPFTHPTRSARIMIDDYNLGFIGELHPDVAVEYEISQPVTVCELDLDYIVSRAAIVPRAESLPRYPAANRDLAIVVPKEINASIVEEAIKKTGGDLVSGIRLFDLYEGKQVPDGKRSLAYAITYRREEGTLTEAEINDLQKRIEENLLKLGAVLRS
jgi:phenylalanyl-tRNA synthetase beta chain